MFTVDEVAALLRVKPQTIYRLCAAGKLSHYRVGVNRGTIRISQEAIDAYITSRSDLTRGVSDTAVVKRRVTLKHLRVNKHA